MKPQLHDFSHNLNTLGVRKNRQFKSMTSKSISLNVGCELVYEAHVPTPILLLIRPCSKPDQKLLSESFTAESDVPVQYCRDAHGNDLIRTMLVEGVNVFRHEAALLVPDRFEELNLQTTAESIERLPIDILRYTFPSRYCESDKLHDFAKSRFGHLQRGTALAQEICTWVHRNIEYRFGSGAYHLSAAEVLQRGYGVCRDIAHVMVTLCRACDLPARYVAGHIPRLPDNRPDRDSDMGVDFHAYCEVHVDGQWLTFDPRHNRPLKGRVKVAHGMDAVDTAIATMYGDINIVQLRVWSCQTDGRAILEYHPAQNGHRSGKTYSLSDRSAPQRTIEVIC